MPKSSRIKVFAVDTPGQLRLAFAIRRRVFIEEQSIPEEIELDDDDVHAYHVLATLDGQFVGTGRMLRHGASRVKGGEVKIGRMAVLRENRGSGVGREILEHLMHHARAQGYHRAILHAQVAAAEFYRKCGFRPVGAVFDEAGIAHRKMVRVL